MIPPYLPSRKLYAIMKCENENISFCKSPSHYQNHIWNPSRNSLSIYIDLEIRKRYNFMHGYTVGFLTFPIVNRF